MFMSPKQNTRSNLKRASERGAYAIETALSTLVISLLTLSGVHLTLISAQLGDTQEAARRVRESFTSRRASLDSSEGTNVPRCRSGDADAACGLSAARRNTAATDIVADQRLRDVTNRTYPRFTEYDRNSYRRAADAITANVRRSTIITTYDDSGSRRYYAVDTFRRNLTESIVPGSRAHTRIRVRVVEPYSASLSRDLH